MPQLSHVMKEWWT